MAASGKLAGVLVDLQLNPATTPWPDLLAGVRAADDEGFDTVWVFDHLSGAMLRGDTMLECFTLVGALAGATHRLGVGTLVANLANRPAAVVAAAASTAQALSGGRFRLGVGAGASPTSRWSAEHRAVGIPLRPTMAERHAVVAEALALFDALWARHRDPRYDGFARPEPSPPVILGVNTPALARLAGAAADGVNAFAGNPALADIVTAAREAHAGRSTPFEVSVWAPWDAALVDPAHPERRRLGTLGVDRLVLSAGRPVAAAEVRAVGRRLAAS